MTLGLHAFSLFKMAFEMQKSPSNNGVIVWVWEFLWLYFFHLKKMKEIRNNFLSLSLLSQVVALEIWYFYFFLPLSFTSDFSNKLLKRKSAKVLEVLPATMFPERATTLNPSATLSTLSPWVSKTISSFWRPLSK